ncbi:MAG TPA: HAMP domain-containing sensor histidine kinase [Microbacterium sp.]|nr:HAMP domain-containing sensor histidine kinase [Microbacterium sp.]
MMPGSRMVSARARILVTILAVAFVGFLIVGSVTFLVQRERILREVDTRLNAQVATLGAMADTAAADPNHSEAAGMTVEDLAGGRFDSVEEYLRDAVRRLVPGRNEASVGVIDAVPRLVPQTLSGFDISQNEELIARAVEETGGTEGAMLGTAATASGTLRYIAIPVAMPDDPTAGLYIRAVDLGAELEPVTTSMVTFGVAALGTLLAIAAVGWFVVGRLLSPIRRLRATADAITISDLGARIPEQGNDDISDLTRTVNSMLARLEGSVGAQRQLLDDVRHELKTPITIVRGHLEMMDAADAGDVQATRELGIAELDRLTRLVEDIDLLAAVEGDQFAMEPVALCALTARMGELVTVIPGHDWRLDATGQTIFDADADRLLQAWLQLAENAAKYTPVGAPIEVGSGIDGDAALLWVRDHGPGIPPQFRHRIFQRFDRAHGARTVGGSGLGLAIVEAIAKAHGGSCDVADTPGGGATFTIRVPLAPSHMPATPAPPLPVPAATLRREVA